VGEYRTQIQGGSNADRKSRVEDEMWQTFPEEKSKGKDEKDKPSGMMSFLSRRKGRERSPKPTERGVLGRGNVRQVVGNR
jgi:hypothetical protein